jgi:hypothetical protein
LASTTSTGGWADATNTGVPAGVTLTASGDLVITKAGTVISGLDIHGTVYIDAPNVTLIDCKVTSASFSVVQIAQGVTGAVVQNCEINGVGTGNSGSNGINGQGTFTGNNIYNVENGINVTGASVIQNNYIHGLQASGSPHYDGIQIDGGVSNVTISHNTVINQWGQTSAVMIDNYFGPISNISVDNNLLSGGGYTVYTDAQFTGGSISGVSFTNNHIGAGQYGTTDFNKASPTFTGNVNDGAALVATLNTPTNDAGGKAAPPGAPVISSFSNDSGVVGDGITNDSTLTLTGTAAANSTVKVFDGATQIGTTTANSSGSWDYITSVLTNAKHVLTATATDTAGTSAASSALTVTVDTVAPNAPVIASSAPASNNAYLLKGTAEANSSLEVFDGATQIGTVTTNSTGAWNFTTATLANGNHSFTAKAMDVAGNTGVASAAVPVTISAPSAPAPGAPAIVSFSPDSGVVGDGITNNNTPTLAGTAAANSTVKVFDGATQIGTATANSNGAWTFTTAKLTDGNHSFTATDTVSGKTGAASSALSVTVDTAVPAAPTLVSDPIVNTNHVLLSGTAQANSTITVYDGTTAVGTTTTGSNGAWSVTTAALANGAQALTAKAQDAAGNTSALSQALDPVIGSATPPAAPKITSFSNDSGLAGDHVTNDNTLTLTGTAVASSTVKVFDGLTQVGTATANSSGQWTLTTPVLSDGAHSLTATDTDSSGHTSAASSVLGVTVDTHAPAAPTMAVYTPGGSAVGSTTTVDDLYLKGTAEANSTVNVFDSGKQIGTVTANSAGAWSFDTGHIADGSHNFTSKAVDVAGNTSAASAAKGVAVNAPVSEVDFTNLYENSNHTATIKGTADAYSQIKLYDGTASLGSVTAAADGTWNFTTASAVSNTVHTFKAQEIDSTGHVVANSGSAILGSSHSNTLTSNAGDNFIVGNGHPDTFVFASNFGNDVIKDFLAGGRGHDVVQFSKSVFDSFADVLAHATQVGHDVVISSGVNESLTLKNIKLGALNSHDFHFA